MSNVNGYGAAQELDILIMGCYQPSIPDGVRAIGLAGSPSDEVAMDITAPLVAGTDYTISFWSYSETTFRVQGDVQIGVSTANNAFGTLVYTAPTVPMTWVQHTFTFTAPINANYITVRNIPGAIHWNHVDHFEFAGCTPPTIDLGNDTTLCTGSTLALDATFPSSTYEWQDNSTNSTFTVTQAGTYTVEVTDACGTSYDTIDVAYEGLPIVDLGNDTTLCPGATLALDATFPASTYEWQDNSTSAGFLVNQTGTYFVDVTNFCGTSTDTILVNYDAPPIVNLGADTVLCQGATLLLDVTYPASSYLWQDNSTNATFTVIQAGTYSVDVTNFCGTSSDDIIVTYEIPPSANLGNDTTLCTGATLLLDASIPNGTYLWQDNSTNATFNVNQPGTYYVDVTNICGLATDTINVDYESAPTVNLGNDTTLCTGASLLLDATQIGTSYIWQDNSTNPTFNVTQAGVYDVDVTNICGTTNDAITVTYEMPPTVNLGNDTVLCPGANLMLDATYPTGSYVWQDNSTNATFNATQSGTYYVDVTALCGIATDTINIDFDVLPTVDLGNDTNLCAGATLLLDANFPNSTYSWQDNSTNSTYSVVQTGTYSVDVTNFCGTVSDDIEVTYINPPTVDLGNDTSICAGGNLLLDATQTTVNYLWQDNSTNATYNATQSGTYWVTVTNNCGSDTDSIDVSFNAEINFDLGEDQVICDSSQVILEVTIPNSTTVWQNQFTGPTYTVTQSGTYTAVVNVDGCEVSDTIFIQYANMPFIDLGPDRLLCEGDSHVLSGTDMNASYLWSNGSAETAIQITEFDTYSVIVTNQCGSVIDSIVIGDMNCSCVVYFPNTFTPDGDEFNQHFKASYECDIYSYELSIYNRWGELLFFSNDPDAIWDGTYNGKVVPNGTYIYKVVYEDDYAIVKRIDGHVNVIR